MKKSIPDQHSDFELISRFLHFELSGPELQAFEERLESDPVLQERFRLYREMDTHIDEKITGADRPDFRRFVRGDTAGSGPLQIVSRRSWVRVAAAAVALLLPVALWLWLWPTVLDSPAALADHYWDQTDKEHLLEANRRGDVAADPDESARSFFRSIRDYHEQQQFSTMIDQLEVYLATTPAPIPFEDDAQWLLAIAYVANSKLDSARQQLGRIIERYPLRRARAQELLDDIRQLESDGEVRK